MNTNIDGFNRIQSYFLVHTFKIKKDRMDSIRTRDIAKTLKFVFGFNFVNLRAIGLSFWWADFRYAAFKQKIKKQTDMG